MTESSNTAQDFWFRGESAAAEDRLRTTVDALVRARRLQVLVDHAFAGLALGLALATVVVLVARLASSSHSVLELSIATVIATLAIALLVGWGRRPDALDVAIRADVALRMKQRLSTAWEYMTIQEDAELVRRLAAQAVKERLPARPGLVFPLRLNRWARLAPLAATALLLASVFDFTQIRLGAPSKVDERVVEEGHRLSAFGREMQARAAREKLPLSAKQAGEVERLGARMQSGTLARRESLGLLRQLGESLDKDSRQAAAGMDRKRADSRRSDGVDRPPGENAGQMLEGDKVRANRKDSRALSKLLHDLARSGASRQEVEDSLRKRYPLADDEEVRAMLEDLAQIERARREQEELHGALAQLRQAQENLGESIAGLIPGRGLPADDEGEDQEGDRTANAGPEGRSSSESRGASRFGGQSDSSTAIERGGAQALSDPAKSGPILKPQGDVRAGESLVTHGQVLPKVGRPSVENVQMSAEFATQVEEVLSKEQYPAHSKEFIRRYFLSLSQGMRAQAPGGAQ